MQTKPKYFFVVLALLALATFNLQLSTAYAQGTAFTYQGRLSNGGTGATGSYDFRFRLAADNQGNTYIGSPLMTNGVPVTNGLFVTAVDFGAGVFSGSNYWLEVDVRTNGAGGYTALYPLQAMTPAPYAIYASVAGAANTVSGTVANSSLPSSASFSGAISASSLAGNGAGVTNVNAMKLNGLTASNFWQFGGNSVSAGQFLGSTDNQPVEIHVNGQRALRMEYGGASALEISYGYDTNASGAPNIVGGSPDNVIAPGVVGAVVAGGGATNYEGEGSSPNSVSPFSDYSVISGGLGNIATNEFATVSGGRYNTASGEWSTVSGGNLNIASGRVATVPGGDENLAAGEESFAAGNKAQALNDYSFVWGDGNGNGDGISASTGDFQFDVYAYGGVLLYSDTGINLAGDVAIAGGANPYHHLSLNGGNSTGYLYGSYPALGDGIHLGYNYYYDNSGAGHVINTGGATSRISAKYGEIVLAVGGVNAAPNTVRLDATTSGVTVYGTFNNSSDRNVKQKFAPVNPAELLAKVVKLPISEWSYKTDATTRHIGPMGQDFYSVFNIGTDEKHIAPIDEGGVALAAIQGLNQKLDEKDAEIKTIAQQNASLKERLSELEAAVKSLTERK